MTDHNVGREAEEIAEVFWRDLRPRLVRLVREVPGMRWLAEKAHGQTGGVG